MHTPEFKKSDGGIPPFSDTLSRHGRGRLSADEIRILQLNVGYLCNMSCKHCHFEAGPARPEVMTREVMEQCLRVIESGPISTVDITGGAPELNPDFRWLVRKVTQTGRKVMYRTNLTALFGPGMEDMPQLLADHKVEILASMPHYDRMNTELIRGEGSFQKSIDGLRALNGIGYGEDGSGLILNLVHNPAGAALPASQSSLEDDYRVHLGSKFGISFNRLLTLANMPIGRFKAFLEGSGEYERYMNKLVSTFNKEVIGSLMCSYILSVDWRGILFDCDFNQAAGIGLTGCVPRTIFEFDHESLSKRQVSTGEHCYACTAGSGST